jgi:hypothetical protein
MRYLHKMATISGFVVKDIVGRLQPHKPYPRRLIEDTA